MTGAGGTFTSISLMMECGVLIREVVRRRISCPGGGKDIRVCEVMSATDMQRSLGTWGTKVQ